MGALFLHCTNQGALCNMCLCTFRFQSTNFANPCQGSSGTYTPWQGEAFLIGVSMRKKHGYGAKGRQSPEYSSWKCMKDRCERSSNAGYKNYGGKGVKICERWQTFINFLSDMGMKPTPKHTIDRIDNAKGYEPGNCRWATMKEQQRNRSNNRMITFRGETKCLSEWEEIVGGSGQNVRSRLRIGWSIERAITQKIQSKTPKPPGKCEAAN